MTMLSPSWRSLIAAVILSLAPSPAFAAEPTLRKTIDSEIAKSLSKWGGTLADICTDADFVRRIHLDLTGAIPTAAVTREFLADTDTNKRARLMDRLLASDAYARHMAVAFDVMLMERRPDKYVTTPEWRTYLTSAFKRNEPLDALSADILGADGVNSDKRPVAKFYLDRAVEKDTLVRDIGRLFLGVDLQCAQCHDHPSVDDYLHEHYYGLSVFVAGSKIFRQSDGKMVLQEFATPQVEFASVFEPDTTRTTGPRLLNVLLDIPAVAETGDSQVYVEKPSRTVRAVPRLSMRRLLSTRLPSEATPEFARNMANRLWAMMMGRGLVHPLDMHHSDNPPSHPVLLDRLASRLHSSGFNTKAFLREIALSDSYQRSSLIPEGVAPAAVPPESFAVANMKGLSPEQLFASLLQATGSERKLNSDIETALTKYEAAYKELQSDEKKLNAARAAKRAEREKEFIALFGSTPGRPEGEFQASLPHALFLANSETVNGWLEPGHGNLMEQLLKVNQNDKVVKTAYLQVLSRTPTAEERNLASEHLSEGKDRKRAVLQFVWSLLASAEFRLNH